MSVSTRQISLVLVVGLVLATAVPALARTLVATRSLLSTTDVKSLTGDYAGMSFDISLVISNGLYIDVDPNYQSTVTLPNNWVQVTYNITKMLPAGSPIYAGSSTAATDNVVTSAGPWMNDNGVGFTDNAGNKFTLSYKFGYARLTSSLAGSFEGREWVINPHFDTDSVVLAGSGSGLTYDISLVSSRGKFTQLDTTRPSTVTFKNHKGVIVTTSLTHLLPADNFHTQDNVAVGVAPYMSQLGVRFTDGVYFFSFFTSTINGQVHVDVSTDDAGVRNVLKHSFAFPCVENNAVVKSLTGGGDWTTYDLSFIVSDGLYTDIDPNYASSVTTTDSNGVESTFVITAVLPGSAPLSNIVMTEAPYFSADGLTFVDGNGRNMQLSYDGSNIKCRVTPPGPPSFTRSRTPTYSWAFSAEPAPTITSAYMGSTM